MTSMDTTTDAARLADADDALCYALATIGAAYHLSLREWTYLLTGALHRRCSVTTETWWEPHHTRSAHERTTP